MYNSPVDNSKDREFKGFFWGYIVIAFVAIFGGAFSLYSRINGITPFLFSLDPNPGPVVSESQQRLEELAQMKLLDSDGDTISDFDEEYTFSTSAYLVDTDSDGLADNVEIDAGENPICAKGQTCFGGVSNSNGNSNSNVNSSVNTADVAALSTDDPVELRRQLAALGIDETVLSQVSDEDLLSVYASVQQDYSNSNTTNTNEGDPYAGLLPDTTNTNSTSSVRTASDLENLTPDAVRDLLIQSGMSASDLEGLDDETLMQAYEQALQQTEAANTGTNQ